VLEAAEQRFGLGLTQGPQWVRDRVGTLVDSYMLRHGGTIEEAGEQLIGDRAAMNQLVSSLRVGETRFFRDAQQWDVVIRHLCERFPVGVPITALSAGCSTGEEAYTLGILLAERGRKFEVLGVDRSKEAIAFARAGNYMPEAVREVPPRLLARHFETDGQHMRVRGPVRSHVSFEVRDLTIRVPRGPFHIIVFKNVLLYLAEPMGAQVAAALANELWENGFLVSAGTEAVRLCGILDAQRLSRGIIVFNPRRSP
jgi:chemotaxis protein methyltransferase CheR